MIGQTLSHYRILGPLGAGGMGIVYLAEDERLGRQVALKLLPADAVSNQAALDRFRLEARTASSLSHPGICAIYDIGMHDGAPYIVIELLRGETLRERIARGPMKIGDVVDVGIQLADALSAAHAQGIVHRDVKPANIHVGDKLRVKMLDFGLAKLARDHRVLSTGALTAAVTSPGGPLENQLTTPGTAIGTVSYMSPEQARGEEVDARSDVFSLGVVLYEMVTCRQAFAGSTSAVVFDAILNRAPVAPVLLNPDTPSRLQDAINRALEKDRELRYQHAADLEADLKRIRRDLQSGQTISATHTAQTAAVRPSSIADAVTTLTPPVTSPTTAATSTAAAAPATSQRRWIAPAIAVIAAAGVALWISTRGPAPGTTAGPVDGAGRAQVRLDARDYRAALAEASAVLAYDPANAEAARIKAAAEARLAELDTLLTTAAAAISANDAAAAARALSAAQDLAPGDSRVTGILARLRNMPGAPPLPAPRVDARQPTAPPPPAPAQTRPAASTTAASAPPVATAPAAPDPAPAAAAAPAPSPPPVSAGAPSAPVPASPAALVEPVSPPVIPRPEPPPAAAPAPPPPARDSDETLIRRAIDTYERAIESKDLELFRSVRPGLSADEERRLRASFAQVQRQQVEIRIEDLTVTGETATARLARQDVVETGGRTQTTRSTQTLRLARRGAGWIIVELGR